MTNLTNKAILHSEIDKNQSTYLIGNVFLFLFSFFNNISFIRKNNLRIIDFTSEKLFHKNIESNIFFILIYKEYDRIRLATANFVNWYISSDTRKRSFWKMDDRNLFGSAIV